MADHKQGAAEFAQVLLEYVEGHDVQVVRRLVEYQQIGILHQYAEQVEPALLAPGEPRHFRGEHVVRKEEASEQPCVGNGVEHCGVVFQHHALLPVISGYERSAPFYAAAARLQRSGEQVEEGGLAYTVPPHYAYLVGFLETVAEVAQQRQPVPVVADMVAVYDPVAEARSSAYAVQADLAGGVDPRCALREVMERVYPVFGLAAAGAGSRPYPFEFAPEQVAHLVGLRVVVVDALLPLLEVVLVVAPVGIYRAVVEFHDRVAHPVEEVAVVGDHEQCAAAALQIAFKVFHSLDVEVVGGLVEYQEVGLEREYLAKGHPLDLSSREFLHLLVRVGEVEAGQMLAQALPECGLLLGVECPGDGGAVGECLLEYPGLGVEAVFLLEEGDAYVFEEDYPAA